MRAAALVANDQGHLLEVHARGVALIVRALQKAGVTFDRVPSDMMPADLAKRFGVLP